MTTKATLITAMAAFADIISYHVDIYIYTMKWGLGLLCGDFQLHSSSNDTN